MSYLNPNHPVHAAPAKGRIKADSSMPQGELAKRQAAKDALKVKQLNQENQQVQERAKQ
jgi:hypothetical protein